LPVKRVLDSSSSKGKSCYVLPDKEYIIWIDGWYWYLPPKTDEQRPMAVILVEHTKYISAYEYPLKFLLLPITLTVDTIFATPLH
jgi:hypothetical protein